METIVYPNIWLTLAFIAACLVAAVMWGLSKTEYSDTNNSWKIKISDFYEKTGFHFTCGVGIIIGLVAFIWTCYIITKFSGEYSVAPILYPVLSIGIILVFAMFVYASETRNEIKYSIFGYGISQSMLGLIFVMCINFSWIWPPLVCLIVSFIGLVISNRVR